MTPDTTIQTMPVWSAECADVAGGPTILVHLPGRSEAIAPEQAERFAAQLVKAAAEVRCSGYTGEIVAPADCKVGEFYVALNAGGWPGPVPFILSMAHARTASPGEVVLPAAWGFSVYRRQPGYRMLGVDFAKWCADPRNADMVIRRDYDRVAAHEARGGRRS